MLIKLFNKNVLTTLSLASVLMLTACGKTNETTTNQTPSTPPSTDPMAVNTTNTATATASDATAVVATSHSPTGNGEKVYQTSCRVCHDTGNLGSPRIGDKAAWQPRIAQGKDTLYAHAINGFTGKTGTMPPKGTSTAPDADIKAAVDYIVAKSQ